MTDDLQQKFETLRGMFTEHLKWEYPQIDEETKFQLALDFALLSVGV